MSALEIPEGNEAEHQPPKKVMEGPAETMEKGQQAADGQQRKTLATITGLCGVVLILILLFVPDWNPNQKVAEPLPEGEKPLFADFDPVLPLFNENITKGYKDEEDLKKDLEQFALLTLNQSLIISNTGFIGEGFYRGGGCGNPYARFPEDDIAFIMTPDEGAAEDVGSGGSFNKENIFDNVNSFETNNQEEGIDTADTAKSDGTFIYAAYGDTLVVFNAESGEIKSNLTLPAINVPKQQWDNDPIDGKPLPIDIPLEDSTTSSSNTRSYMPPWFEPKPQINGILLEGDMLTLVVAGYGSEYIVDASASQSIFCDYLGTRLIVYKTTADGSPQFISQQDVHGSFQQGYSVQTTDDEKVGHVVTRANIDVWTHLQEPMQRHYFSKDLSEEEYHRQAMQKAKDEVIPKFVSTMSQSLSNIDLTRLSLFVDNAQDEDTLNGIMSQLRIADTISFVSSFVMDESSTSDLTVSMTGTTQPGYWGYVYANNQMIVLADKGYTWVDDKKEYVETTYLVGFRLDGASTKHEIVGSVRGTPLNPYSIDLVERENMVYVRIATTMVFWNNRVIVDVDIPDTPSESTTWNEIVVLGTEKSGSLLEKKSGVRLGKPDERFTAVRFMDDIAYAVTFLRRDPFYAVDLTNPDDISILGELDISGFSEYLHPIEGDKLLAIGQETDDEGMIIGLQISLFGAADPSKLTLINRLVIEDKENQYSSSTVSWEPKAFRYFTVADTGILIIPMNLRSFGQFIDGQWKEPQQEDNFEGFAVFTVANDTIARRFDIDHLDFLKDAATDVCNSWCGSLPQRSFVIDGNLLTMREESVVSTDLGTETAEWFLDVRKTVCCN